MEPLIELGCEIYFKILVLMSEIFFNIVLTSKIFFNSAFDE